MVSQFWEDVNEDLEEPLLFHQYMLELERFKTCESCTCDVCYKDAA